MGRSSTAEPQFEERRVFELPCFLGAVGVFSFSIFIQECENFIGSFKKLTKRFINYYY